MQNKYYNYSSYLKKRFNAKVWKISVDAEFTCPNRDGTKGTGGCIYCNNKSFNFQIGDQLKSVEDQITQTLELYRKRKKAEKYFIYFQTYTNTYAPINVLKKYYDLAIQFDDVVGLAIGTRPDCINDEILDLVESYNSKVEVWMEYGLQTMHNRTLEFINRGHTYEDFVDAVKKTRARNLLVCVHIILGLPGETQSDMLETAKSLAALNINGIKFHPLHVLKETRLADLYATGEISMIDQNEYVNLVCDFLEILPPDIVVQRLTSDAPKDLLIAPEWCSQKNQTIQLINEQFEIRNTCQGINYKK